MHLHSSEEGKPEGGGKRHCLQRGYCFSMLIAGTLGTALIVVFVACRKRLIRDNINVLYYWLTVVMIPSAGTAAGDFLAHELQLHVSTVVTGLAFIGLLVFWKKAPVSTTNALSHPAASR